MSKSCCFNPCVSLSAEITSNLFHLIHNNNLPCTSILCLSLFDMVSGTMKQSSLDCSCSWTGLGSLALNDSSSTFNNCSGSNRKKSFNANKYLFFKDGNISLCLIYFISCFLIVYVWLTHITNFIYVYCQCDEDMEICSSIVLYFLKTLMPWY